MQDVEWGEYKIEKLFTSSNGDFDIQKKHINGSGDYVITSGLTDNGILGKTDIPAKVFEKGTITADMFGYTFYRQFQYKMVTHARVFSLKPIQPTTINQGLFLSGSLSFLFKKFGYENMCTWEKIKSETIKLPAKNGEIDFDFMERFIAKLEEERMQKLIAYLKASGLDNYELSGMERETLESFGKLKWKAFNLEDLFGKSTRGKRLKSSDRIPGNLPFITAGEADVGISDFIKNDVEIFHRNTTTIDMFGSAKYRSFEYGGDDHIAVVHTENLPTHAAIFVATAIHKSSHNGQFNYGKNFYAKDADKLWISLPVKNGKPDFETMETLISAVQKLVIKDVVLYADKKIEAAKTVVHKNQS